LTEDHPIRTLPPRAPALSVACCALALLAGCGKRGDPLVPLSRNPPAPAGVKLFLRGDHIEVRYQAPRATAGGLPLGVMEIEVQHLVGEGDFEKRALRERKKAAPGEALRDVLPLPPAGSSLRVAVRAIADGRTSPRSAIAALTVRVPPPPPTNLRVDLDPKGATLTWTGAVPAPLVSPSPAPKSGAATPLGAAAVAAAPAVGTSPSAAPSSSPAPTSPTPASPAATAGTTPATTAPPGAAPSPTPGASPSPAAKTPAFTSGFWIYRHDRDEPADRPLVSAPLQVNTYTDKTVKVGETFCYEVRAVAATDPVIESVSSDVSCVTPVDKAAPTPPTALLAVPGAEGIELSWTASADADVASYGVYRATGDGGALKVATVPAGSTTWRDAAPPPGVLLRYTLTAIDASGNESAPTSAVEAQR
jgi:hypothetical protein